MATLQDQQQLAAEKAQYETDYKATIKERRAVANRLNDPNLTQDERNTLNSQYIELNNRAEQLDKNAITAQNDLNRVTNQINQGPNPPVGGPGSEIPPYANQNTGGTPNNGTSSRYQQAVADDQVRLNEANQGLANTNNQLASVEKEKAALSSQLRNAAPGSPEQAELLAKRNELNQKQAELETQQQGLKDDIRVRENSLATNKNNLSLVQEGNADRVSAPPPNPTMVTPAPTSAPVPTSNGTDGVNSLNTVPVTDGVDSAIPSSNLSDPEISVENAARRPLGLGGNYSSTYNPETGTYDVVNLDNGQVVESGLSELNAEVTASQFSQGDPQFDAPEMPPTLPDLTEPEPPGGNYGSVFDPETQTWGVIDKDTGVLVQSGFNDEASAELQAQLDSQPDPYADQLSDEEINESFVESDLVREPTDQDADEYLTEGFVQTNGGLYVLPEEVDGANDPYAQLVDETEAEGGLVEFTEDGPVGVDSQELAARQANMQATLANARAQAALKAQRKQADDGDWRVKLRLAPGSNYLYRANDGSGAQAGILQPLVDTDGVIFPYTPQINTNYKATYNSYDLTHSNYRGYFYQGSAVEEINVTATFTAQDTYEAQYLLAVIHFFRSITKMFYGQDGNAGTPPPLVFLQGLGEYQFNLHPCVVSQFTYNLPNDVDYIRARSPNQANLPAGLLNRRSRQTVATNPFEAAWNRLKAAGVPKGGMNQTPAPTALGTKSPTYVPTKIDLQIALLPIQSRAQVSNNFSLQKYANGDLLKGGFW